MELEGVKIQYFRQQLERGIRNIFEKQKEIATARIYSKGRGDRHASRQGREYYDRSGSLLDSLTNPRYLISVDGSGVSLATSVPTYIRFLDMRRLGNYHIYNRPIWGILYGETLQNVKYEFRDWLDRHFPELLQQFNNQLKQ